MARRRTRKWAENISKARLRNGLPFELRFWSKVDTSAGDDGCWPWLATKTNKGYGQIGFRGKQLLAHRVAWTLLNGKIPEGINVLHRCDNPECCNAKKHHFLGTQMDNMKDRDAKGRHAPTVPRGEGQHLAKLKDADVVLMRKLSEEGAQLGDLAARFGIAKSGVCRIVKRQSWKHIP